jgi:hypothetical protein
MAIKTLQQLKDQFGHTDPEDHNTDVVNFANVHGAQVAVSADWATAANAAADILAATGLVAVATPTLILILWQGAADPDDYAALDYDSVTPAYTVAWTSAPTSGSVYIIGSTLA